MSASATRRNPRPTFNNAGLHEEIMRFRAVDHVTNLGFLAFEYACIGAVVGGTVVFCEWRRASGLAWGWDLPVLSLAMLLMGGLQHRLAGLGHESAHYTLVRNK